MAQCPVPCVIRRPNSPLPGLRDNTVFWCYIPTPRGIPFAISDFLGFVDGTDFNLFGFADPDADGKPEAIFVSEQDVVLINPSDNSLSFSISVGLPLKMAGVTDLTGDGHPELIVWVADGAGGYVQEWSKP